MTDRMTLRLMTTVSMLFALGLAIVALTTRLAPTLPGYLMFLFIGLVGSFAERSLRSLERRVAALEARQ